MKTQLFLLTFFLCSVFGYSQELEVTPNGFKDKLDKENSYVVIKVTDKSANELYTNAIRYVNQIYKNPEEVINGKIENKLLKYETYVPQFTKVNNSGAKLVVSMKYTTELRFKDGKVRYEVTSLSITADNGGRSVEFSGSIWKGYPIYNQKNGKLRLPETKKDLENYFNSRISDLFESLSGESDDEDW